MDKNKKELVNAPPDKVFYVCNGQILYNLKDLLELLKIMTDETFSYHCNKNKNDFRLWIRDVLKDRKLARDIRWTTTKETMKRKISDHLKTYYKI